MKRLVIAAAVVVFAFAVLVLVQYLEPFIGGPAVAEATGVVKSVSATPVQSPNTMQPVTVTLSDGSVVEANVIPGCLVAVGDAVRIQSFRRSFGQRGYLVLGPMRST